MIQTFIVYFTMLFFMLLSFNRVRQLSPYSSAIPSITKPSLGYKMAFLFPLILFSIIMGIRYDVGVDHLRYIDHYIYGYEWGQREILFSIINNSFALLRLPYTAFFFICAFIQIGLFCYAFRKEPWLLVWLVFFWLFFGEFQSWNNIIRASISAGVFTFSLEYLEQKKIVPLVICTLVAIGFHASSIVVVLIYFAFYRGKNYFSSIPIQYLFLIVALVLRALFYRFSGILETALGYYYLYMGGYDYYTVDVVLDSKLSLGTGMGYYFVLLVNIIVIAYSGKLHSFYNSKRFNIIYNVFFVGIMSKYMIPGEYLVLHRPFVLFTSMTPVMYAYLAYYLYKKRGNLTNLLFLMFLMVSFVGMYVGNVVRSDDKSHLWYQTYWEHPETPTQPVYKPRSIFVN